MSTTVHVENINSKTSEQEVKDFFAFCGKISKISITPTGDGQDASKSATVTFEKETAAKTALLLDSTKLGESVIAVKGAASLEQLSGDKGSDKSSGDEVEQEDKPRSRIIAEYLPHGYVIGDKAIQNALALDQQHGISSRFTTAIKSFDNKYKATDRAKDVDAKLGVTDKTYNLFSSLNSYYEKALGTPTGQRLAKLYEQGNKEVMDVHNEARRLADLKAGKSTSGQASDTAEGSEGKVDPEKAELHYTGEGDKTACNCAGASGKCACVPGKCSCSSCAKNTSGPAA